MRSLTTTLIWIVSLNVICAQVPLGFSFQTIIRDSEGKVLKNQATGLQFSILEGSSMGTVVYSETHTITTNEYGVINLTVGTGTVTEGVFSDIVWGSNIHFLKTEIDPTGGNTYTISTTSQLMSVPYAMYAMKADTALKFPDSPLITSPFLKLSETFLIFRVCVCTSHPLDATRPDADPFSETIFSFSKY